MSADRAASSAARPLLLDEFGGSGALRMPAEIIRRGERVFQPEPAIDGLRHLIGGEQIGPRPNRANGQTSREEQDQPIPVEDLRPNDEQHYGASHTNDGCERGSVDQQMRGLAAPATPDQVG